MGNGNGSKPPSSNLLRSANLRTSSERRTTLNTTLNTANRRTTTDLTYCVCWQRKKIATARPHFRNIKASYYESQLYICVCAETTQASNVRRPNRPYTPRPN